MNKVAPNEGSSTIASATNESVVTPDDDAVMADSEQKVRSSDLACQPGQEEAPPAAPAPRTTRRSARGQNGAKNKTTKKVADERTASTSDSRKKSTGYKNRRSAKEKEEEDDEDKFGKSKVLKQYRASVFVGPRYQVSEFPDYDPTSVDSIDDRDTPIWIPALLDDGEYEEFVAMAVNKFQISIDRALFVLMQNEYKFEDALKAISNIKYIRDEWTPDEDMRFMNGLRKYGKNFRRLQKISFPQRSVMSLVYHYYEKKRWEHIKIAPDCNYDDSSASSDGNNEICDICQEVVTQPFQIQRYNMCKSCYTHHMLTYTCPPLKPDGKMLPKRTCPDSMAELQNEFDTFFLLHKNELQRYEENGRLGPRPTLRGTAEARLESLTKECRQQHREVHAYGPAVAIGKYENLSGNTKKYRDFLRQTAKPRTHTYNWTYVDKILATHYYVRYADDQSETCHEDGAEFVGTKSPQQMAEFKEAHKCKLKEYTKRMEEIDVVSTRDYDERKIIERHDSQNSGPVVIQLSP